ncbi:hypothetical protein AAY473_018741 [Plecturocebus cupreus]
MIVNNYSYLPQKKGAELDRRPIRPSLEQGDAQWRTIQSKLMKLSLPPNPSSLGESTGSEQFSLVPTRRDANRTYTPINTEAPENQRAINLAFVSQSGPDIKRKLQKLEGF